MSFFNEIGPCVLDYDGTVLGETKDTVTLEYTEETVASRISKTGTTARSKVIVGQTCKVTGDLAESTLEQIAKVMGGTVTGSGDKELVFSARVGHNLLNDAAELILKPVEEGVASTDEANWVYIPKATVVAKFSCKSGLTEGDQRVYGFEFEGHPLTADDVASGATWDGWAEGDLMRFGLAD